MAITDHPSHTTTAYGSRTKAVRLIRQEMNTWEIETECSSEIRIRQCNYHPLDLAHSPVTYTGVTRCDCLTMKYASFLQLTDAGSGVLPLFSENCPKTPYNPAVN